MKYNNNIVLNILSSEFLEEIEDYTIDCVWRLDPSELWDIFDEDVDFAELDYIDGLYVEHYEVERQNEAGQEGESEYIIGTLEVSAYVDGYEHWDNEDIYIGNECCNFSMAFDFRVSQNEYWDLGLELI